MAVLSEEQRMLRDMAEGWVRDRAPVKVFRQFRNSHSEAGYDTTLFQEMVDMGWTGILIPEQYGGSNFGYQSLGVVLEQLGRNLVPNPIVHGIVTAICALLVAGIDEQKAKFLPRIADEGLIIPLAVDEGTIHQPDQIKLRASRDGDNWRLDGEKRPVIFGTLAEFVIVAARESEVPIEEAGISLFLLPTDLPGIQRTGLSEIDPRGAAIIRFDNTIVSNKCCLGLPGKGAFILEQILDQVRACLSAEMLGGAQQAFETTVDYMKTRVQFGQTLSRFQALQHRAANLYGELELTRSAVGSALIGLDSGARDISTLVSIAKSLAGDTFRLAANEMVQLHGGIGMTDEHDAGLYLKRARTAELSLGNSAFHRERYAIQNGY
jgi:alkylation response protein AidB-like acyl-CoA dehydrogenase